LSLLGTHPHPCWRALPGCVCWGSSARSTCGGATFRPAASRPPPRHALTCLPRGPGRDCNCSHRLGGGHARRRLGSAFAGGANRILHTLTLAGIIATRLVILGVVAVVPAFLLARMAGAGQPRPALESARRRVAFYLAALPAVELLVVLTAAPAGRGHHAHLAAGRRPADHVAVALVCWCHPGHRHCALFERSCSAVWRTRPSSNAGAPAPRWCSCRRCRLTHLHLPSLGPLFGPGSTRSGLRDLRLAPRAITMHALFNAVNVGLYIRCTHEHRARIGEFGLIAACNGWWNSVSAATGPILGIGDDARSCPARRQASAADLRPRRGRRPLPAGDPALPGRLESHGPQPQRHRRHERTPTVAVVSIGLRPSTPVRYVQGGLSRINAVARRFGARSWAANHPRHARISSSSRRRRSRARRLTLRRRQVGDAGLCHGQTRRLRWRPQASSPHPAAP